MRASSVFIILVVLDAFLLFGMTSYASLTGGGVPSMIGLWGSSPFTTYLDIDPTTGTINTTGEGFDAASLQNTTTWSGAEGIVVSASQGDTNFAFDAFGFIQMIFGLITAPFTFVYYSGLGAATYGIAYIFALGYLTMMAFSIYQIITGRST